MISPVCTQTKYALETSEITEKEQRTVEISQTVTFDRSYRVKWN